MARQGQARSLAGWAATARGLLAAYMLTILATLALALSAALTFLPSPTLLASVAITAMLSSALALIAMVALLIWVYRAHANLPVLGLHGLRYTPAWAVGSFFVPLVNLVVPFRAMRALYNRSMGEDAHFEHVSVSDVTSWWACFVVGNALQLLLAGLAAIERLTPIFFTTPPVANFVLAAFASLLLTGSAFFLQRIVGAITRAQASSTGVSVAFA